MKSKIQFGIKLSGMHTVASGKLVRHLEPAVDYFEYSSPVTSFHSFAKQLNLSPAKLRPHSTHLSIASKIGPSKSILNFLKNELSHTKSTFIGEHIGLLNRNELNASQGYVFPPVLNRTSVQRIVESVERMQNYLEVPVALENPVLYKYEAGSKLSWCEFLAELDAKLPKHTGWLIDFAHAMATSCNLNEPFKDILNVYSSSNRIVYEAHISAIKKDRLGVIHDDHKSFLGTHLDHYLHNILSHKINIKSYTLERKYNDNYIDINSEFKHLKNSIVESLNKSINLQSQSMPHAYISPSYRSRVNAESNGRLKIFKINLEAQLSFLDKYFLKKIIKRSRYKNMDEIAHRLINDRVSMKKSIPRYDPNEWDGIDLVGPFYDIIRRNILNHRHNKILLSELLLKIALRQRFIYNRLQLKNVKLLIHASDIQGRSGPSLYEINTKYKLKSVNYNSKNVKITQNNLLIIKGDLKWELIKSQKSQNVKLKLLNRQKQISPISSKAWKATRNTKEFYSLPGVIK